MVGVGGKENEFENQELETTGDDVWGWERVVAVVVPAGWECPGPLGSKGPLREHFLPQI